MTYAYQPEFADVAKRILSAGKSKAAVCAEIGVSRDAFYDWVKKFPEFEKAVKEGSEAAQSVWEDIGHDGITGKLEKFSGTPWMFVMKTRFKEDWGQEAQSADAATLVEAMMALADKKKD